MLSNRALVALRTTSRQCSRPIHSTARKNAEEPPKRAGRKERSTLISNEVSKLQQGPPPPAERPAAPTASAGFLDTPPSPSSSGRMGQNAPPEREGPAAQGIARPSTMTEPSEGGTDVLSASAPGEGRVAVRPSRRSNLPKAAGRAYAPVGFAKKELLRSGEGTATIAAGNFEGVVEDRIQHAFFPGRRAGVSVSKAQDGQKVEQGQVVRESRNGRKRVAKGTVLGESTRKAIVGRLVQGKFGEKVLQGERGNTVDEVRKRLLLNGTYLRSDARKLVEKVQGFLTKEQWGKLEAGAARRGGL